MNADSGIPVSTVAYASACRNVERPDGGDVLRWGWLVVSAGLMGEGG
jgi:hypothetical protein